MKHQNLFVRVIYFDTASCKPISSKKAGIVLDLQNDKAVMFENPVNLQFTFSGHYCINSLDKNIEWKTGIYSTFGRSNVAG